MGAFDEAVQGFRALAESGHENFFVRRDFARSLMEVGAIDEARPLVRALIEDGFRQPRFLKLVEESGLLPESIPPAIEFDSSIPPALQARFDAARHVRLPWELPAFTGPEDEPEGTTPVLGRDERM